MSGHTAREREAIIKNAMLTTIPRIAEVAQCPKCWDAFKDEFLKSARNQERWAEARVTDKDLMVRWIGANIGYALEAVVHDPHKVIGV